MGYSIVSEGTDNISGIQQNNFVQYGHYCEEIILYFMLDKSRITSGFTGDIFNSRQKKIDIDESVVQGFNVEITQSPC